MNKIIDVLISANIAEWKASMTLLGYDMGVTIEPQRMPSKEYIENLKVRLESVDFFNLL